MARTRSPSRPPTTGAPVPTSDRVTAAHSGSTFTAPTTNDTKNATIEVSGTGFAPVTAAVHGKGVPFAAKVDGYITKEPPTPGTSARASSARAMCPADRAGPSRRATTFTYRVKIKNLGNGRDSIKAQAGPGRFEGHHPEHHGAPGRQRRCHAQFLNAGYTIRNLNPGGYAYFWVKVKLKSNATSGNTNAIKITGQSVRKSTVKDVVRAKTTVQ